MEPDIVQTGLAATFITAAIIGLTQFIQQLRVGDYWSAVTVAIPPAIGVVASLMGLNGISIAEGIVMGLSAAGVMAAVKARTNV